MLLFEVKRCLPDQFELTESSSDPKQTTGRCSIRTRAGELRNLGISGGNGGNGGKGGNLCSPVVSDAIDVGSLILHVSLYFYHFEERKSSVSLGSHTRHRPPSIVFRVLTFADALRPFRGRIFME